MFRSKDRRSTRHVAGVNIFSLPRKLSTVFPRKDRIRQISRMYAGWCRRYWYLDWAFNLRAMKSCYSLSSSLKRGRDTSKIHSKTSQGWISRAIRTLGVNYAQIVWYWKKDWMLSKLHEGYRDNPYGHSMARQRKQLLWRCPGFSLQDPWLGKEFKEFDTLVANRTIIAICFESFSETVKWAERSRRRSRRSSAFNTLSNADPTIRQARNFWNELGSSVGDQTDRGRFQAQ